MNDDVHEQSTTRPDDQGPQRHPALLETHKTTARRLRVALGMRGVSVAHGQALDLTARLHGLPDWNTLSAMPDQEWLPPGAGHEALQLKLQELGLGSAEELVTALQELALGSFAGVPDPAVPASLTPAQVDGAQRPDTDVIYFDPRSVDSDGRIVLMAVMGQLLNTPLTALQHSILLAVQNQVHAEFAAGPQDGSVEFPGLQEFLRGLSNLNRLGNGAMSAETRLEAAALRLRLERYQTELLVDVQEVAGVQESVAGVQENTVRRYNPFDRTEQTEADMQRQVRAYWNQEQEPPAG